LAGSCAVNRVVMRKKTSNIQKISWLRMCHFRAKTIEKKVCDNQVLSFGRRQPIHGVRLDKFHTAGFKIMRIGSELSLLLEHLNGTEQ
jgi:hypothetical protein